MRCPKCGSKLPKGSTFCKNCNTAVQKKPSVIERIGKIPLLIGAAVIIIAAIAVFFFILSDVPVVKFDKAADTAKYVSRRLDLTFFDTDGSSSGTAKNVTRTFTNKLGTLFAFSGSGRLYIARADGFEQIDESLSDSRVICCAEYADVIYYEKNKELYRWNGASAKISKIYGTAQFCAVSPDGSCAAWGASERGENTAYVYRGGNVEELSGADEIMSVTDDGSLMYGTAGDELVICSGNSRTFTPICKCGAIKYVSADGTQVIFTDEHNPAGTYLYDNTTNEKIFLYSGSVTIYCPDGMRQSPEGFDMFLAEAVNHTEGTVKLMQFRRNGSSYTARAVLDLGKISRYTVSADGERIMYLDGGKLTVKSTVSSFGKENVISGDVYEYYTIPALSETYFLTTDFTLYYSDGGTPVKIASDVGASQMMSEGVCTFVSEGVLYYSEKGSAPTAAEGIGKIKYLFPDAVVDENDRQFITYDGKDFIDTNVNRS